MDLVVFNAINGLAGKFSWLDAIALLFAKYAIYVLILLVLTLWFKDWGLTRKKNMYAVVMAFEAVILARGIIAEAFYFLMPKARPFVDNSVNLLLQHAATPSFPSGHTTLAFAISLPVFLYNRKAGWWLLLLSALIAVSRIYVGVHWPSDIIGGFAIALVVTLFLNFFKSYFITPVVKILK